MPRMKILNATEQAIFHPPFSECYLAVILGVWLSYQFRFSENARIRNTRI